MYYSLSFYYLCNHLSTSLTTPTTYYPYSENMVRMRAHAEKHKWILVYPIGVYGCMCV